MKSDYPTRVKDQRRTNERQELRRAPKKSSKGFIIANPSEESIYADIARKLKENIDIDRLGVEVTGVKKTRSGICSYL